MRAVYFLLIIIIGLPAVVDAQSYDLNKARLTWNWIQGAPPSDGTVSEFRVKCGQSSKVYNKLTVIADPAARSVAVRQVIQGSGNWYCVIHAANVAGESGPSNEVFFLRRGNAIIPGQLNGSAAITKG